MEVPEACFDSLILSPAMQLKPGKTKTQWDS